MTAGLVQGWFDESIQPAVYSIGKGPTPDTQRPMMKRGYTSHAWPPSDLKRSTLSIGCFAPKLARAAFTGETDYHTFETAAGPSLSAAMVLEAMVLCSGRDSGGVGAFCNSFLFQRRIRSKSAGQRVGLEQARSNGIGQCDSRSQREDLWPNLCGEPRDGSVREVGSRFDQWRHCCRRRKILRAPRLRSAGDHSRSAQKSDGRPCPARRQYHHTTTGAQ